MVWYCIGKIWYRAAPSSNYHENDNNRGNDNAESWCCCCCCGLGLSATATAAAAAADSGVVVVAILPYEFITGQPFIFEFVPNSNYSFQNLVSSRMKFIVTENSIVGRMNKKS